MSLQLKLLTASGIDPPSPPTYRHLVSENVDTGQMWKEVLTAVQVIEKALYKLGHHYNLISGGESVGQLPLHDRYELVAEC